MEERSLKVYSSDKTFFSKLTNKLTKMLVPTKVGINGVIITLKRNNVLKAFENYIDVIEQEQNDKKEACLNKYEEVYALYLEAIDKYVIDSIYKKVKNDTANEFEKNALSRYYNVIRLKDTEYLEYKYRKQKYLLELDYETVEVLNKEKLFERYKYFYSTKMDTLYKGLLKNYSIKLAENLSKQEKDEVYNKIFDTLEEYIANILPIKIENEEVADIEEVKEEYEEYKKFEVGKLDQIDIINKRTVLLGLSRKIFTHSLPLIVAEQCYVKILKEVRNVFAETRVPKKKIKAYEMLISLMDEYNDKLLCTKIYWDKPTAREEYKQFQEKYKKIEELKEENSSEYEKQKQILFIRFDLSKVRVNEEKYEKVINAYKRKLVALGDMRQFKDSYRSEGTYVKIEKIKNEEQDEVEVYEENIEAFDDLEELEKELVND